MKDLAIELPNEPGALAAMGEALGRAGISIEGGGAFVADGKGVGHFLFADGAAARQALEAAGFRVLAENEVVMQRLEQGEPGQLGKLTRQMAEAGVNIEVQYSDHDHRLVLVVEDATKAQAVADAWSLERANAPANKHEFHVHTAWTGNNGEGTRTYQSYRRDHVITAEGKEPIEGSSAPEFRGDARRYNPEELLVASLSACHMLRYLHLCASAHIVVVGYEDAAEATMREAKNGSGEFVSACLRPRVTIASGDPKKARELHSDAHHACFIANSVKFPISIEPEIRLETAAQA
jgi:organic hydroperoxide reductase OsmC/OhrA